MEKGRRFGRLSGARAMARLNNAATRLAAAVFVPTIGVGASAWAADLPVKAPPLAYETYSWTGCYAGGNAGGIGNRSTVRQYPSGASLNTGFQADRDARTATVGFDNSEFAGGGQIGCNWQPHRNLVYGIETDLSGMTPSGTRSVDFPEMPLPSNPAVLIPGFSTVMTHKLPWLGTVRGRVGWAWDRMLVYATGGLAYGRVESTFLGTITTGNAVGTTYVGSSSSTRAGWTIGGGIEAGLTANWSVKAEYLYLDLGKFSYTAFSPAPAFTWGVDVTTRAHIARLGLNYRFGGGPVVARY
jgi:outer membrane immunogenic protein